MQRLVQVRVDIYSFSRFKLLMLLLEIPPFCSFAYLRLLPFAVWLLLVATSLSIWKCSQSTVDCKRQSNQLAEMSEWLFTWFNVFPVGYPPLLKSILYVQEALQTVPAIGFNCCFYGLGQWKSAVCVWESANINSLETSARCKICRCSNAKGMMTAAEGEWRPLWAEL